jgi:hypothetical protein
MGIITGKDIKKNRFSELVSNRCRKSFNPSAGSDAQQALQRIFMPIVSPGSHFTAPLKKAAF